MYKNYFITFSHGDAPLTIETIKVNLLQKFEREIESRFYKTMIEYGYESPKIINIEAENDITRIAI